MRITATAALLFFSVTTTMAQIHLKANIQNNHLWRGMEVADGAVLLTDVSCNFAHEHLTVGLWGGTNTEGSYKEFNHYVSFQAKGFGLALWDTYNFSPGATYNNREYFNYSAHSTGRFLDCTASYRLPGRLPLLLSWSTILFGRDRSEDNQRQRYSTFCYAELPVVHNTEWQVETGIGGAFALHPTDGEAHFYGSSAGIVHLTLAVKRNLRLGNYHLPVYVRGVWNPQSSQAYLQLGAEILNL